MGSRGQSGRDRDARNIVGAGHTPVIVVKDSGKIVNAPTFYMQIKPGEILREDIAIDAAGRIIEE